jgi:HlyD family secretion protein
MRWILLMGSAAVIAAVLFNLDRAKSAATPTTPSSQTRLRTTDKRQVFANGVVEGKDRDISLRFEITGTLLAVTCSEGDPVRKGDLLARLEPSVWAHEVAKAEASLGQALAERERLVNGQRRETREWVHAQLRVARAQAMQVRKRLERAGQLRQSNAIAQQELDDLDARYAAAEAEVEAAMARADEIEAPAREDELAIADAKIALEQARYDHARTMLSKTELRAPCDALVLQLLGEPGELVGPENSLPIVTMVNASETRVRAYVEELDALAVAVGQRAYVVADALPHERFWGTVVFCSPQFIAKPMSHNAPGERVDTKVRELLIRLDEPGPLVFGLRVDVFITPDEPQ